MTRAEVEQLVQSAIAGMPEPETGLTAADVEDIVEKALASLPQPAQGLTADDVAEAIREAMRERADQAVGLTAVEVQEIARDAVASIPLKSTPADYTKFVVDNAIRRYDSEGLDATLSYYNRVESVDGQWYVFIIDDNDKVIGHYDAHLLGEDLKGPLGTDANGYNFGPEMLSATGEGKWVSYVYRNPESGPPGSIDAGEFELKNAWVVRHKGLIFGSGWYVKADDFTKAFVLAAVNVFRAVGLEGTTEYFSGGGSDFAGLATAIEYYNNARSIEGEWIAFIADADGIVVDHYDKGLVGRDLGDLVGLDSIEATREGNWITTDSLRVWVVNHRGMLFGSGWQRGES